MQVLLPVLVLLLLSLPAHAQIYKCTSDKNSVVYSDNPCAAGDDQSLPGIVNQPIDEQPSLARKPPVILQLDTAVKSAIAVDDFTRAEALATTREHWEWIADARKNAPKDVAANQIEPAECTQAKARLEQEAGKPFPDAEVLQAKQSIMYAACGVSAPLEIVTETPAVGFFPYYNDPYGHRRYPHRHSHGKHDRPPKPSGYTSPPYDRHKETPFGSRFIRPESIRR